MSLIRTPDERFTDLPDYPFAPHYIDVMGARMHYVDEGQGEVILCLHGEPTWSYLYRKMIPLLTPHYRVIAPDLIGFGKSDKYTDTAEYSFQRHRDWLVAFLDTLNLHNITLVCQDWGGLIGLRVAAELPERFARLVIMNTGMPDGSEKMSEALMQWRAFSASASDLQIGMVIRIGTARTLSDAVMAAYDAPFPDASYKAGAQIFPQLIPDSPDAPGAAEMRAAREVLSRWKKPALVMFSDQDPITRGGERFFCQLIPHARRVDIQDAGHFLQEDKGEKLAQEILVFMVQQ